MFTTNVFPEMNTSAQKSSESYPSKCDKNKKVVQTSASNLDRYLYKEIYTTMDLIVDQNRPLRDIDKAHFVTMAKMSNQYNYDYAPDMMTVFCSIDVNQEDGKYASTVHNIDSLKFLKNSNWMFMLVGRS